MPRVIHRGRLPCPGLPAVAAVENARQDVERLGDALSLGARRALQQERDDLGPPDRDGSAVRFPRAVRRTSVCRPSSVPRRRTM